MYSVSELPCVSCGADIPAEASNCPHCGQRQMTRSTAIGYMTVGLPAVLLSLAGALLVGVPSVLDATIGVAGLAVAVVTLYCLLALAFLHAYAKRKRLIDKPTRSRDENTQ